jgi:hypothetical protein
MKPPKKHRRTKSTIGNAGARSREKTPTIATRGRQLVTKGSVYGSKLDEDMMFCWLDKIPSVVRYKGRGVELVIDLKEGEIEEKSLRELIGLFFRYELDLSQLQQLESTENGHWFRNPGAYWYSKVFKGEA